MGIFFDNFSLPEIAFFNIYRDIEPRMLSIKKIHLKKGETLQRKGEVSHYYYGVEKGLLRSFSVDNQGKEHIFMFAPEGWIIADGALYGQPCELNIEALEDSDLLIYEKNFTDEINPERFYKRISVLQKRVIMLMSSSAIDRYEDFLDTYPQIVQRVSQRMIASYLGITPEALSRAKKEQFQKPK